MREYFRPLRLSLGRYHFSLDWYTIGPCTHGPQSWPWWKLFALSYVRLDSVEKPSTGHRLWLYTRAGGRAFDLYIDRREGRHG